ncbi:MULTISPECIES: hypothetical protein [unclassified Minwuia]|uniref:hypothetical protein n=1 Tax=unclassified Minwuia TaxID=2618799 RepID=UPI00247AA0D0|nr:MULTISPECIES: hypothetical protein [unclassified Minwuia]
MIDAATFSSSYNAFWAEVAPMLEHFTRRLNLEYIERFDVPMASDKEGRKALIAELAFSLMVERHQSKGRRRGRSHLFAESWNEATRRLRPFVGRGVDLELPLQKDEKNEVLEIEKRLMDFFNGANLPVRTRPLFKGCGFVDASEGDILTRTTLFEVKTVDRSFRSADLRQLLTYAALNAAAGEVEIPMMGLVNPRRGVSFEIPVGELCSDISGRTAQDLFALIIQVFSSGELSR